MFARQIQLLFKSNDIVSICKRAKVFITTFSRHLHEFDVSFSISHSRSHLHRSFLNLGSTLRVPLFYRIATNTWLLMPNSN
jgi:hypothetical protein